MPQEETVIETFILFTYRIDNNSDAVDSFLVISQSERNMLAMLSMNPIFSWALNL